VLWFRKVAKLLKDRSQDKRRRIEAAALALFTTQGFHGTNNREIAKRAGVSTAAIYTHYPSKEALFAGLVGQHRALVAKWLRKTIAGLKDPLAKPDLTAFASAIRAKMRKDPEYFLLSLSPEFCRVRTGRRVGPAFGQRAASAGRRGGAGGHVQLRATRLRRAHRVQQIIA
jgi:AcrR family transcriptional regulator